MRSVHTHLCGLTPSDLHNLTDTVTSLSENMKAEDVSSEEDIMHAQPLSVELSPPRERYFPQNPPAQRVAHAGGKRPRAPPHGWRDLHAASAESDSEDDEGYGVDLEAYFAEYGISQKKQVLVCRSYASYVAARLKEKKRIKVKELK